MKFRLRIFVNNFNDATNFVSAKHLEKEIETTDKGLTSEDLLESKCLISTERLDLCHEIRQ